MLLADDLRARIRDGEWSAGDRLPTEAELVVQYQVSRSTVRQAVKTLQAQGLLTSRQGKGTYLSSACASMPACRSCGPSPRRSPTVV